MPQFCFLGKAASNVHTFDKWPALPGLINHWAMCSQRVQCITFKYKSPKMWLSEQNPGSTTPGMFIWIFSTLASRWFVWQLNEAKQGIQQLIPSNTCIVDQFWCFYDHLQWPTFCQYMYHFCRINWISIFGNLSFVYLIAVHNSIVCWVSFTSTTKCCCQFPIAAALVVGLWSSSQFGSVIIFAQTSCEKLSLQYNETEE